MTSRRTRIGDHRDQPNHASERRPANLTNTFRSIRFILFFIGIFLMTAGAFLAQWSQAQTVDDSMLDLTRRNDSGFLVSTIFGALLSFVGGVRLSLVMPPRTLFFSGSLILLTSVGGPLVTAMLPSYRSIVWSGSVLVALFLLRILGFIFATTATFRWKIHPFPQE